jgi:hypothetical protein
MSYLYNHLFFAVQEPTSIRAVTSVVWTCLGGLPMVCDLTARDSAAVSYLPVK